MKKSVKDKNSTKQQSVSLHPVSLKYLAKGHPWVIKDKFTDQFPGKQSLLYAKDHKKNYTLLHDPKHANIKARLWSSYHEENESFDEELKKRLGQAIKRRLNITNRENFYLIFGEADYLPGLLVQWLKEGILVQSYCGFWKKKQKTLVPYLRELLEEKQLKWVLWQDRDYERSHNLKPLWGKVPSEIIINEYGVDYKLIFNEHYDIGIYSDMSAIRHQFKNDFKDKSVLNLYAYTGAWALFALQHQAKQVTNIDLSQKYLDWLNENMKLNDFKDYNNLCGDTLTLLKQLGKDQETFDYIICDPPSFSSDGSKTRSALKSYNHLIPLCATLMNKSSKFVCFINTHSVTQEKFEQTINHLANKVGLTIDDHLSLTEDCPKLDHFPEGNYLKGLILKK